MVNQKALLFAVVIFIIILIIAYVSAKKEKWARLDYWKVRYVESPDQVYERSNGEYDEAAAIALQRSEDSPTQDSVDHHRAATIIHRNVIAQERQGGGQEETRQRLEMFDRARDHYMAALQNLTGQAIAADEAERAIIRYGLPRDGVAGLPTRAEGPRPGAEFIIDTALNFAFAGFDTLVANDPFIAAMMFDGGLPIIDGQGIPVFDGDQELAETAENRRNTTIEVRQAAAAEAASHGGGGRGARAAAYLDLSQRETSDSQNSHDPSVNASKRSTIERLRKDQGPYDRLPTLEQISDEIAAGSDIYSRDPRTGRPRPILTDKVIEVIKRAGRGERSHSTGASDEEVLRRVWARADDPKNLENRGKLLQSAYDSLLDCWEPGTHGDEIQCVDGRISRVLGALVLLDHDDNNWEMRRLEQHKNEIFAKTTRIIRAVAEEAAAQTEDAEMQKVGRSYLAQTKAELDEIGELDKSAEEKLENTARDRTEKMIDSHIEKLDEKTKGAIPAYTIESIKKEALAAIG